MRNSGLRVFLFIPDGTKEDLKSTLVCAGAETLLAMATAHSSARHQ